MPRKVSVRTPYRGGAVVEIGGKSVRVEVEIEVRRETRMIGPAEDAHWIPVATTWSGHCRKRLRRWRPRAAGNAFIRLPDGSHGQVHFAADGAFIGVGPSPV